MKINTKSEQIAEGRTRWASEKVKKYFAHKAAQIERSKTSSWEYIKEVIQTVSLPYSFWFLLFFLLSIILSLAFRSHDLGDGVALVYLLGEIDWSLNHIYLHWSGSAIDYPFWPIPLSKSPLIVYLILSRAIVVNQTIAICKTRHIHLLFAPSKYMLWCKLLCSMVSFQSLVQDNSD